MAAIRRCFFRRLAQPRLAAADLAAEDRFFAGFVRLVRLGGTRSRRELAGVELRFRNERRVGIAGGARVYNNVRAGIANRARLPSQCL